MLLRWGYALVPIVASMTTLVSLTGVGLIDCWFSCNAAEYLLLIIKWEKN
jgi:hypothetical protein